MFYACFLTLVDESHLWTRENKDLLKTTPILVSLLSHNSSAINKRAANLLLLLFQVVKWKYISVNALKVFRDQKNAFTGEFISNELAQATKPLALKVWF